MLDEGEPVRVGLEARMGGIDEVDTLGKFVEGGRGLCEPEQQLHSLIAGWWIVLGAQLQEGTEFLFGDGWLIGFHAHSLTDRECSPGRDTRDVGSDMG